MRCSKGVRIELNSMSSRNFSRRLERLEAELAPRSDKPALTILVTSPGQPDRIIEVHGNKTADRRRRPGHRGEHSRRRGETDQQAPAQA